MWIIFFWANIELHHRVPERVVIIFLIQLKKIKKEEEEREQVVKFSNIMTPLGKSEKRAQGFRGASRSK
jgi:hypothetical protein